MGASVDDTFDVSYALVNHDDLKPDHSLHIAAPQMRMLDDQPDESLAMSEASRVALKPGERLREPHLEEEKFFDFSNTESKTRAMTNPFLSHPATTSKKRTREEMSGNMSLYDDVVIAQREAAGHQAAHAFRSHAEEEGLKRVHARDLEMHMKSKKQLYTCLTLEGKYR